MLGGGGILGVGPAEMVVVFGVGWLLLGPTKLFSLSRDVGRVVGDLKRTADEASTTFTEAMEMEVAAEAAAEKGGEEGEEGEEEEEEEEGEGMFDEKYVGAEGEEDGGAAEVLRDLSETMVAGPAEEVKLYGERSGDAVEAVERDIPEDLEAPLADDAIVSRTRFLEQLNRANDPEQTAKAGTFDKSGDLAAEEDVEVARLEYELAKARLAAKQKRLAEKE